MIINTNIRGTKMNKLLEILNELIQKYNIAEEDVNAIQAALSEIEGNSDEEFKYEDEEE